MFNLLERRSSRLRYIWIGAIHLIWICGICSQQMAAADARPAHGDGTIAISGELQQWHKVTLTLDGPFASELDHEVNPFTDYRMTVVFRHEDGLELIVPGYFAADGNAANTSADAGTKWKAHFSPDEIGTWKYAVRFQRGPRAALFPNRTFESVAPFDGATGSFEISPTDKSTPDLRSEGRLTYVNQRYLRFAGSGRYFLKAGADAPETLLAYADFDGTTAGNPRKSPLKTWAPHLRDWQPGDPQWKDGKGKGLIGAINYLSVKGCNAFSFLSYNAGGDGNNVWPFVSRNDKLHYDCSKLDQWGIVFDHGTAKGMYLHFKMQETEIDDNRGHSKSDGTVPESLDGGDLGPERRLYCRELIARFGHNLALNWNLGEENTQSTKQQIAMINYIAELDAYDHPIVVHTFPDQQAKVYEPLLQQRSKLTGASLQNSHVRDTHADTLRWVRASEEAGRPWVVAFDESGSAAHGQCPDLGYRGFDGHDSSGKMVYTEHEVRRLTLWGTLMAGGAGCEYYFGYRFVENDLLCEDWRSRDRSWDYCRYAIEFFRDQDIPFWEMNAADELIRPVVEENPTSKYCFCKPKDTYLVYLPYSERSKLDLRDAVGRSFTISWFNPRTGGPLQAGSMTTVDGGQWTDLGDPPSESGEDWLVVVRRTDDARSDN